MTLNIWNTFGRWELRRVELARILADSAPDVLCLQEVVERAGYRQALDIAAAADHRGLRYHICYGGVPFEEGRLGNAILTRERPLSVRTMPLPGADPAEVPRTVVIAELADCFVLCTHLSPRTGQAQVRRAQVAEIARVAGDLPHDGRPLILAGDFNAPVTAPECASLLDPSAGFVDVWPTDNDDPDGFTWTDANPNLEPDPGMPFGRVDLILVSGIGVQVNSTALVGACPVTGHHVSDHFGVMADLAIGGSAAT